MLFIIKLYFVFLYLTQLFAQIKKNGGVTPPKNQKNLYFAMSSQKETKNTSLSKSIGSIFLSKKQKESEAATTNTLDNKTLGISDVDSKQRDFTAKKREDQIQFHDFEKLFFCDETSDETTIPISFNQQLQEILQSVQNSVKKREHLKNNK